MKVSTVLLQLNGIFCIKSQGKNQIKEIINKMKFNYRKKEMNIHFNRMSIRNKIRVRWNTKEVFQLNFKIKVQFSIQTLQKRSNR